MGLGRGKTEHAGPRDMTRKHGHWGFTAEAKAWAARARRRAEVAEVREERADAADDDRDARDCQRCHRPVVVNAENYELFERMHWSCFHYEFEHDGDPDAACGDPSCPARRFDPSPPPTWRDGD